MLNGSHSATDFSEFLEPPNPNGSDRRSLTNDDRCGLVRVSTTPSVLATSTRRKDDCARRQGESKDGNETLACTLERCSSLLSQ